MVIVLRDSMAAQTAHWHPLRRSIEAIKSLQHPYVFTIVAFVSQIAEAEYLNR